MIYRFLKYTFTVLLLFYGVASSAQQVTVETRMDSTAILIGEQVRLHTIVSCPKDARIRFPEFKNGYITEGVEMLEASHIDTILLNEGKRWELHRDYTLTSFDSAVYVIPRVEVEVNGKKYLSRNEIGLKVNTVEVDLQHPDDLRPLKAPVDGVFEWTTVLLKWCLLLWLCTAAFFFFLYKLLRAKPVTRRIKVQPPTPPQKTAMAAIERLKGSNAEGDDLKLYYMALTDVLRTYIVERFGFNAREMTTYEIIQRLRASGDANAIEELQSILDTADLVKFAKYGVSLAESDRSLLQAVDYVRSTQINDPEAEKAVEKIVVVSDKKQQAYKIALKCGLYGSFAAGLAIFAYVSYLLWLNFC